MKPWEMFRNTASSEEKQKRRAFMSDAAELLPGQSPNVLEDLFLAGAEFQLGSGEIHILVNQKKDTREIANKSYTLQKLMIPLEKIRHDRNGNGPFVLTVFPDSAHLPKGFKTLAFAYMDQSPNDTESDQIRQRFWIESELAKKGGTQRVVRPNLRLRLNDDGTVNVEIAND